MRIGIDARFYGSIGKGLGRYTEKLIEYLEEVVPKEDEFFVFLRRENFEEYIPKGKNFQKVLADFPWYGFSEQCIFPFLIARYRLDLMHFPHFNVPILVPAKTVVTIHDLILFHYPTIRASRLIPAVYWLKYLVYRLVIWFAVFRARTVFVVSQFTRDDIVREYPFVRNKLFVTKEGVDRKCFFIPQNEIEDIADSIGLKYDTASGTMEPYFLYVGNAYPHKNLELLVSVAKTFPEYRFLFVGREDYFFGRLKRSAESVKNILFTGFVSDRNLSILYRNATAYLFPSKYEGFGLPGLEAMNYGLPVIAANAGSLPEVYRDAAIFFDPDRKEDLERAIRTVCRYESVCEKLRETGFRRIARYDWKKLAVKTYGKYRDVVHGS